MTTPVDPRPYAAPTDLVTAEDVARWLAERAEDEPRTTAWCLHDRLTARLDRERRQACRRGALAGWREFARAARRRHNAWTCGVCADTLARALAFRAAARQP